MTITTTEAILGIYICCAASDGELSVQESARISNFASRAKFFIEQGNDALKTSIEKINTYVGSVGVAPAIDLFATIIPANLKQAVYANACDLIMADGNVGQEEMTVLQKVQTVLDIDGDTAKAIVKVIGIKNSL